MNNEQEFFPPRRRGMIIQGVVMVIFGLASGLMFWMGTQARSGESFLLLTLAALALIIPIPILLYSMYALLRSSYTLDRDGLRLRWGLRAEDIPLPEIEWVRPADELVINLPLPWRHWPGAVRGVRKVDGLGPVEFMASSTRTMLLVATAPKVFVISPEKPEEFRRNFQRFMEMGSLAPLAGSTVRSMTYLRQVWGDRTARLFILAGLMMVIGLFLQAVFIIPSHASISLGYDALGNPQPPGPPESILLLPILASLIYSFDVMLGFFFYRIADQAALAYILWGVSVVTSLLLLGAASAI
jgi:hypothetical protein